MNEDEEAIVVVAAAFDWSRSFFKLRRVCRSCCCTDELYLFNCPYIVDYDLLVVSSYYDDKIEL